MFVIHPDVVTWHLEVGSWVQNLEPYPARYLPAQAEVTQGINLSSQAMPTDTVSQQGSSWLHCWGSPRRLQRLRVRNKGSLEQIAGSNCQTFKARKKQIKACSFQGIITGLLS